MMPSIFTCGCQVIIERKFPFAIAQEFSINEALKIRFTKDCNAVIKQPQR